jgi:nicotinamidase-related amidase
MADQSVFILIDVQKGFTEKEGSFGKAYSPVNLLQIQETLPKIKSCLEFCQENKIPTIIIRSEYKTNQFKTKGLEKLCVVGENEDCDFTPNVFENIKNPNIITKYENSAMTQEEFVNQIESFFQKKYKKFLVGGFSTNTCVRKTCLDLKEKYKEKIEIVVAQDLTASRSDVEEKENGRFDWNKFGNAINQLKKKKITIIDSYQEFFKQK